MINFQVYSIQRDIFPDFLLIKLMKTKEMNTSKKEMIRLLPAIFLFSTLLFTIGSCSMSNYGKLKSEPEVTQAFEAYRILPGHKYYYWGTNSRPVAIAGIKENYELNSKLWLPIEPESKNFRTLIDRVSLQGTGSTTQPWGFNILDKSGNDVGVWYSAIRAAAVEIDEEGRILNLSPIRAVTHGNQKR